MIIATIDTVAGKRITENLGLVRGSTIRACALGHDILAGLRNLSGGEITEYTKMLAEAREQVLDRMTEEAKSKNADAIIGVRFATSSMMQGAAELLVYGTAVKLVDE